MRTRAAQATTIVLFALVMGVFWGTWFSLSRTMDQLSAETFLAVGHQMIRNLGGPMAVLLPLSLLSALVTLALLWPHRSAAAFWFVTIKGGEYFFAPGLRALHWLAERDAVLRVELV